jgi:hypothetical protein
VADRAHLGAAILVGDAGTGFCKAREGNRKAGQPAGRPWRSPDSFAGQHGHEVWQACGAHWAPLTPTRLRHHRQRLATCGALGRLGFRQQAATACRGKPRSLESIRGEFRNRLRQRPPAARLFLQDCSCCCHLWMPHPRLEPLLVTMSHLRKRSHRGRGPAGAALQASSLPSVTDRNANVEGWIASGWAGRNGVADTRPRRLMSGFTRSNTSWANPRLLLESTFAVGKHGPRFMQWRAAWRAVTGVLAKPCIGGGQQH